MSKIHPFCRDLESVDQRGVELREVEIEGDDCCVMFLSLYLFVSFYLYIFIKLIYIILLLLGDHLNPYERLQDLMNKGYDKRIRPNAFGGYITSISGTNTLAYHNISMIYHILFSLSSTYRLIPNASPPLDQFNH